MQTDVTALHGSRGSGELLARANVPPPGAGTQPGTWLEGHQASHAHPAFPPPFTGADPRTDSVTLALDTSDSSELWAPAGAAVTGSSAQSVASVESSFDVHRLRPQARSSSGGHALVAPGVPGPVAESGRRPQQAGIAAVQSGAELRMTPAARSLAGTVSEASPDTLMGSPTRREQQELLPRDRADSAGPTLPTTAEAAAQYVSRLQLQGHIVDAEVEMVRLPATPVLAGKLRGPATTGATLSGTPVAKGTPLSATSTDSVARRGPPTHVSWSHSPPPRASAQGSTPMPASKVGRLRRLSRGSQHHDERGAWTSGRSVKLPGSTRHRAYDLAVDVKSGLAKSCFRFTKMLHLKDKYTLENCTGETLEVRGRLLSQASCA